MASTIVTMNAFSQLMWPALGEPKQLDGEKHAKYRTRLMWPQAGEYDHPEVGMIDSNPDEIIAGLNEVCSQEFDYPVNDLEDILNLKAETGVQFPPNITDGNTVKKMDDKGRPIKGEFDDRFIDMDFLNVVTGSQGMDAPAVIDHNEDEIDPKKPYSGCWCRIQLEISAYYKDRTPIISIQLLAVQYVYDDEAIAGGGKPPRPDATKSFGKVKNGNAKTNDSKRMGKPGERPSRPSRNDEVTTERVCKAIGDFTIEELMEDDPSWTEDELVAEGYAEWVEVEAKKPSRPSRPERKSPPARGSRGKGPESREDAEGGRPSRPSRNKPETKRPERKAPPAKKAPPARKKAGPTVTLFDDCEYTYEELSVEHGWSDDEIVNSGYGEFNYTDPDA